MLVKKFSKFHANFPLDCYHHLQLRLLPNFIKLSRPICNFGSLFYIGKQKKFLQCLFLKRWKVYFQDSSIRLWLLPKFSKTLNGKWVCLGNIGKQLYLNCQAMHLKACETDRKKPREKFWLNNQIITTYRVKIY